MRNPLVYIPIACVALAMIVSPSWAEDTDGWVKELVAGFGLTDGNSETLQANVGVNAKNVSGDNETTFGVAYNYGETTTDRTITAEDGTTSTLSESDTVTENATADAQYKRNLSDLMYAYVAAGFLYDDIAMVDYRATVGPGLGFRLMNDEAAQLNAEIGAVYIWEDVGGVEDDYAALRLAQTYERKLSDTAKVWESIEYIPSFEDFGNYLLKGEIGIDTKINDSVSLRISAIDRYDSEPAAGLDENDLAILAGVSVKL